MDKLLSFIHTYKNIIYAVLGMLLMVLSIFYMIQNSRMGEEVQNQNEKRIDSYEAAETFLLSEFNQIIIQKNTKRTAYLEFFNKFDNYKMSLFIDPSCFLEGHQIIADVMFDLYVKEVKVSELNIKLYLFYQDGKNEFKLLERVVE